MATKAAKTPWTRAQRSKLTAILQADPNDPPDFVPTAAQAWSATGFAGEPPTEWTPELERSLVDRAWDGEGDLDALVHFLVAAYRKPIEQALKIASALPGRSEGASAVVPVA